MQETALGLMSEPILGVCFALGRTTMSVTRKGFTTIGQFRAQTTVFQPPQLSIVLREGVVLFTCLILLLASQWTFVVGGISRYLPLRHGVTERGWGGQVTQR